MVVEVGTPGKVMMETIIAHELLSYFWCSVSKVEVFVTHFGTK